LIAPVKIARIGIWHYREIARYGKPMVAHSGTAGSGLHRVMTGSPPMSTREYPARPLVGIGAVVLRPDAVLLVRRARPPSIGQWSIPGGAQELGETAEAAARRELWEETGLVVGLMELVAQVDSIHPDETGRIRYHYTILDFAALWQAGEPKAGDDASEARFVPFTALAEMALWSEALRVISLARAQLRV
jgi:8-oxo-dGTP diphosphatase